MPGASHSGQRPGGDAGAAQQPQRIDGRQGEQRGDDRQAAHAGAENVEGVDPVNLFLKAGEGQADAHRRAEERHEQQQVDHQQACRLPRVPEDLEGIERNLLGQAEAGDSAQPEQHRAADEHAVEARRQHRPCQRHSGAGSAVAEQRDADHHVGEMVPLDDRKQSQQQHLIAECGGRQQCQGEQGR
ncbi:hypothetical protein D9M69_517610 [compost metagenome]